MMLYSVLTAGRYVAAPQEENGAIFFAEKMEILTAGLKGQFDKSALLESQIKTNLEGLGYEF